MSVLKCSGCGVPWTMDDAYVDARRDEHDTFYCPNGHAQHFPDKTENEKRIEQLETELRDVQRANTERLHELLTRKHDAERLLTRCPICFDSTGQANWRDETNARRLVEHLQDEHGARARLRSLPPGEAVSGA